MQSCLVISMRFVSFQSMYPKKGSRNSLPLNRRNSIALRLCNILSLTLKCYGEKKKVFNVSDGVFKDGYSISSIIKMMK